MDDVLAMCADLTAREVAAGERLIAEGTFEDVLYVIEHGAFEVVRDGVRVVTIDAPGAMLGEMSAVLGGASSADVVAVRDSRVRVVRQASAYVRSHPEFTLAIARLLARRLSAVTAYLVDIKRQYAGTDNHLALMDQVLGSLVATQPVTSRPGSERSDVPDY